MKVPELITICVAAYAAILSSLHEYRRIRDRHLKTKRRKLHNFVLQAMGTQREALVPDIDGIRFDLPSIDRKMRIAQKHWLSGTDAADEQLDGEILLVPAPEGRDARRAQKKQRRMGLPGLEDSDREQRITEILDDMVDAGRLRRRAPRMWSVDS